MESLGPRLISYLRSPLLPRSNRALATRWLPSIATAILAAVVLVHVFSPGGLSTTELLLHGFSIWLGFFLGMLLAGVAVLGLLRMDSQRLSVGKLWLISAMGFIFGLFLTSGIDSFGGVVTDTATKAASIHGPQSMLLRLLPVWALVTAFLVRSELLDAYESRFGTLGIKDHCSNSESQQSTVVSLGAGETAIEVESLSIILVSAEENYCKVVILNDTSLSTPLVRSTFQSIEQALPKQHFLRVHRSHLININRVERVHREGRRFVVTMRNWNHEVPISRSQLDHVLNRLEK